MTEHEQTPTTPKPYRRPTINKILDLFPPEHRADIEHSLSTIAASAPFIQHPIDALASAAHRLAADLRRMILAHDPNTPDTDPQKILALAATAAAAEAQLTQPASARLQRILNDIADLPAPPSTVEDRAEQTAREKRERLASKLEQIEHAVRRRNTRVETTAQNRIKRDVERERRKKIQRAAAVKRRAKKFYPE